MKKYIHCILILLIFIFSFVSKSYTQKNQIIIDTDCGTDDFRALCQFLSMKEVSVSGIIVSEGSLSVDDGIQKVNALLQYFNKQKVPVFRGKKIDIQSPEWRQVCKKLFWGNLSNSSVTFSISEFPTKTENQKFTYICMSPMTNAAEIVKENPGIINQIEKIIWYNEANGYNYLSDKQSADYIFSQSVITDVIHSLFSDDEKIDITFLQSIKSDTAKASTIVYQSFTDPEIISFVKLSHFYLADDILPVYFLYPDLFDLKTDIKNPFHRFLMNYNSKEVAKKIKQILSENYSLWTNVTFEEFPHEASQYRYDVAEIMQNTVQQFGKEEWKVCVLTNELHGHLGIYSIVGAKMGILAREILQAPTDRIEVVSFAGKEQPLSCFNDGIQASTGATTGLNLLQISDSLPFRAEAEFRFNGKKVRISLKKEYSEQIEIKIKKGIAEYGNLTSGYWKMVRQIALESWKNWNRNEIFNVIILK